MSYKVFEVQILYISVFTFSCLRTSSLLVFVEDLNYLGHQTQQLFLPDFLKLTPDRECAVWLYLVTLVCSVSMPETFLLSLFALLGFLSFVISFHLTHFFGS